MSKWKCFYVDLFSIDRMQNALTHVIQIEIWKAGYLDAAGRNREAKRWILNLNAKQRAFHKT
ncbi:hypothetical protein CK223_04085 [Mesorhizobium loti]|nr:hypothetical protein CK223_04085 [Mesorhizobium loti]